MKGHPNAVAGREANRFLLEVDAEIKRANRTAIKERIPRLSLANFRALAQDVARLRAEYLQASLTVNWTVEGIEASDLRSRRKLYEEALASFEALERAIERGYIEF